MGVLVVGMVAFLDLSPEDPEGETEPSAVDEFLEEHGVGLVSLSEMYAEPLPALAKTIVDPARAITDFDPQADDLVVVWDDRIGEAPDVRLAPSDTAPDLLELTIDDLVIARVPAASGLTVDHVALLPQTTAQALGWLEDAVDSQA